MSNTCLHYVILPLGLSEQAIVVLNSDIHSCEATLCVVLLPAPSILSSMDDCSRESQRPYIKACLEWGVQDFRETCFLKGAQCCWINIESQVTVVGSLCM